MPALRSPAIEPAIRQAAGAGKIRSRPPGLQSTWGTGVGDIWVVGNSGVIVHWDGARYTQFDNPAFSAGTALHGVWGSAANDLWAVGDAGILHFDGAAWSTSLAGTPLHAVWGRSAADVWAGPGDVWIATDFSDSPQHWNGSTWSVRPFGEVSSSSIWGAGNAVWFAGYAGLVVWDGTALVPPTTPTPSNGDGAAAEFLDSAHGWVASSFSDLVSWDGNRWQTVGNSALGVGLWAPAADDVWLLGTVGGGPRGVYRWHGGGWSSIGLDARQNPRAIWGSSESDVWVAASDLLGGAALNHWNGASWGSLDQPNAYFQGMWGSGGSDVWLVGRDMQETPLHGHLRQVFSMSAVAPDEAWALGSNDDGYQLLHWNGTQWRRVGGPPIQNNILRGVRGSCATNVWVHSSNEQIVRHR